MALDYVGVDVLAKFGDSMLTVAELCDFLTGWLVLRTFVRYLIAFYSRPETASHVMSGRFVRLIVPN